MSTDSLSQKIRELKKELTALKTAHRRGLGLLKLYESIYDPPDPPRPGEPGEAILTVVTYHFDKTFPPFPFFQTINVDSNRYFVCFESDGYAVKVAGQPNACGIIATSPIVATDYDFVYQ